MHPPVLKKKTGRPARHDLQILAAIGVRCSRIFDLTVKEAVYAMNKTCTSDAPLTTRKFRQRMKKMMKSSWDDLDGLFLERCIALSKCPDDVVDIVRNERMIQDYVYDEM